MNVSHETMQFCLYDISKLLFRTKQTVGENENIKFVRIYALNLQFCPQNGIFLVFHVKQTAIKDENISLVPIHL